MSQEEPVNGEKVEQGRKALHKALIKVAKHYKMNPMELVYANHEALRSVGDYEDKLWLLFVVESFKEVHTRDITPKLVTH